MLLEKLFIKVPMKDANTVANAEFIPIFQRWIQIHALPGILIDVADYGHVKEGPSVVLVCHDENYFLDRDGGMSLVWQRKTPLTGSNRERILFSLKSGFRACQLLEKETAFGDRLRFRTDEIRIGVNDRLLAPNSSATFEGFRADIEDAVGVLFGGSNFSMERSHDDARERFSVTASCFADPGLDRILENLVIRQ